ncbi:MAG: hypothetical protein ACREWE_00175 [Gammaproteobacteria bacterium]
MSKLPWQNGRHPGAADRAARVRRFARLTGLKPSVARAAVFRHGRPKGADHTNVWCLGRGSYVVTTEPYSYKGGGYYGHKPLEEWCARHGWGCMQAPELGMWNPPDTTLYLLSPPVCGAGLDRVLARTKSVRGVPFRLPVPEPAHVFANVMELFEAAARADVFIYLQDGVPRCTGPREEIDRFLPALNAYRAQVLALFVPLMRWVPEARH